MYEYGLCDVLCVVVDYTMVSFVKPNLLGTHREFTNRFANPISNGQHSDSTATDVRIMKHRAHVLHEILTSVVQVRYDGLIPLLRCSGVVYDSPVVCLPLSVILITFRSFVCDNHQAV